MAIAFDAYTYNGAVSTWTHTCTGTNRVLIVAGMDGGTAGPSAVTYNGVALTIRASFKPTGGDRFIWLATLQDPPTGAHAVVVTPNADCYAHSISYTGATVGTYGQATVSGTSLAVSLAHQDQAWLVALARVGGTTMTGGVNATVRRSSTSGVPATLAIFDSNGPLTGAGTDAIGFTCSASDAMGEIAVALAPFVVSDALTFGVDMEFSGLGNGWTTVTDVLTSEVLSASGGMTSGDVRERTAATGEMTFALNNSATNSAQKIGYYSPGHLNC